MLGDLLLSSVALTSGFLALLLAVLRLLACGSIGSRDCEDLLLMGLYILESCAGLNFGSLEGVTWLGFPSVDT